MVPEAYNPPLPSPSPPPHTVHGNNLLDLQAVNVHIVPTTGDCEEVEQPTQSVVKVMEEVCGETIQF